MKWEEKKKWQKTVEKMKTAVREKESEVERLEKYNRILKDQLDRSGERERERERERESEFEISSVHRYISVGKIYKILNSIFHNFIFLRKSIKFHGSTSEGGRIDNSTKHLFDFSVKL